MKSKRYLQTSLGLWTASMVLFALQPFAAAQNGPDDSGQPANQVQTASQDPPSRVARLTQLQGEVSIQPAGVNDWTQATVNYPLTTGDRMYVNEDGRAELQMEQSVIHVWHYSDLAVTNLSDSITQLGLSQGSLHVRTFELTPNQPVEVDTPNGAITVMQPGDFRVDCYTGDGGTVVTVNSGEVQISGPNLSQNLGANQSVRLMGSNPITLTSLTMPGRDPFDAWSEQRDRKLLASETRQYVDPNTVGSDDLEQYGNWTQTPGFGAVWYPTAVPVGWVPYSTGQWVWVSPWGWTWVDANPWGFAPFHYGRWANYGNRWGWVPGPYNVTPIYSPALVGFVGGPGFSVGIGVGGGVGMSAWFPLGPGEPYFPWYHCSPGYFSRVNVTNINRVTINRVTNMTNITNNNYYNYYHNKSTFNNIHYMNRNTATTAMPANQFASGRPISAATAIHPTSQQMAHTQIISHPFVMPTIRSVVPQPTTSVPVPQARPKLITPPSFSHSEAISRNSPPAADRTDTSNRSSAGTHPQTHAEQPNSTDRESAEKYLVGHANPPPREPSFAERQPALSRDPGRPLGPHQINNLSRGRPAGPARTPEFPPHPAWAPRPTMSAPYGGGRR